MADINLHKKLVEQYHIIDQDVAQKRKWKEILHSGEAIKTIHFIREKAEELGLPQYIEKFSPSNAIIINERLVHESVRELEFAIKEYRHIRDQIIQNHRIIQMVGENAFFNEMMDIFPGLSELSDWFFVPCRCNYKIAKMEESVIGWFQSASLKIAPELVLPEEYFVNCQKVSGVWCDYILALDLLCVCNSKDLG